MESTGLPHGWQVNSVYISQTQIIAVSPRTVGGPLHLQGRNEFTRNTNFVFSRFVQLLSFQIPAVEDKGFEPSTSGLQSPRSSS